MSAFWIDHVAPLRCSGCSRPGSMLCDACRSRLVTILDATRPDQVDRCIAALGYDGDGRRLILELKLRARRDAATPLVEAMVDAVRREGLAGHAVTWVPAREGDVRRRGYDHAEVLARGLCSRLGLPAIRLLDRTSVRPDQAGLPAEQRWANLRGAFSARACSGGIVLVDDLLTTGATASSCAGALRAAGAAHVEAVVAARAMRGDRKGH